MTYQEIKQNLDLIADPVEKLEMVMELGKELVAVPKDAKCSEIVGCVSHVEICIGNNNIFYATADSILVRGIVAIVLSMVQGKTVNEIKQMPLGTMFTDLNINLGASRLNGVNSMIRFLQNL